MWQNLQDLKSELLFSGIPLSFFCFRYIALVAQLKYELERPQDEVKVTAPLEADPQYKLIVKLSHVIFCNGVTNETYRF